MVYRAIGLMSGSSLDGLDIVFAEFQETGGQWSYEIIEADCYPYSDEWIQKLKNAEQLSAKEYLLLHSAYGHYTGQLVNQFIDAHQLHYKVAVIASHGHTTFHLPAQKMTAQLGDGAAIAAQTKLPVVTDLRALDVAFGGQGAPIVPIGEKYLMNGFDYFLNIGGIANITINKSEYIAFDICPANRVLNMLANDAGMEFDRDGMFTATGSIHQPLLESLNGLDYYRQSYPKSLANEYGTGLVYPMIKNSGLSEADALRTYTEHIAIQIRNAVAATPVDNPASQLLATGGGALNQYLIEQIRSHLSSLNIEVIVPEKKLVDYKEALIMAFIGVLRWRQEYNSVASVTGAERDSIGGALWTGQEA